MKNCLKNCHVLKLIVCAFALALCLCSSANAISVTPTNYVATPGEGIAQGGFYNYFDDTGHQLTDGIYGVNNFEANLGNGIAYEWVGWRVADPVITFQFASPVTINQVGIDFNDMIYLPSCVMIDNTDFTVNPSAIPDDTRGTLSFNGSWTGTTLTVDLSDDCTTDWIFVDEITFKAVPEPSVLALLAVGLGLFILRMRRPSSPAYSKIPRSKK
jgi:hypothetical protein